MLTEQLLMLLLQVIALAAIVGCGAFGAKSVFVRYFNPGCWFVLFNVLWFIFPQIASMLNDNMLVAGYQLAGQEWIAAQRYLLGFDVAVLVGMLAMRVLLRSSKKTPPWYLYYDRLTRMDVSILLVFYVAGAAATVYLGQSLMSSGGFRSELVKSTSGKLVTIVMFFGTFAMSVLSGRGIANRRVIQAVLAAGILGTLIFFTGARGRLLWPVAIAIIYSFCRNDELHWGRAIGFGLLGVFTLLMFDPLLLAIREGIQHVTWRSIAEEFDLSDLYLRKRNFDGFTNFAMIVTEDRVPYDLKILFTGGRNAFMTTYFPGTLEKGVGFGATVPGMFWLSGGLYGLLGGGLGFGAMLGVIDYASRCLKREPLFFAYCFAMTWLAAIGGNFQESLDKMVAVAAPGILWLLLTPKNGGSRYYDPPDDVDPDDEYGDDEYGDNEYGDNEYGDNEYGDNEYGDEEHGDEEHGDEEHGDEEQPR